MSPRTRKTKTKIVKKAPYRTWESGDNPIGLNLISPMSYESYMKSALEIMSKNFSVRTYKLAPQEEYPRFERGTDLRVQIWWKRKYLGYEFLVEIPFWMQSNRNKEDRKYMREVANAHLKTVHDAVEKAKSDVENKVSSKKKTHKKRTKKAGITTQDAFDKNIIKQTGNRRKKKVVNKK